MTGVICRLTVVFCQMMDLSTLFFIIIIIIIGMGHIGRQLPARAHPNPFGCALLSPLMMALNHLFSHGESVIALCLLSWGRHLTYLSVILSSQRGCDQCVACCCSLKQPAQQQQPTRA